MAVFQAFCALRPATDKAERVAALPYDVVSREEARIIGEKNPDSFLHVDRAEMDLPADTDLYDSSVYEKARENLQNMEKKGILVQDEKPCYYIYELTRKGKTQTGIVGCSSIDDYISGVVKKHELTREDKEQDRIRHVDVCDANTGPIFLACRYTQTLLDLIEKGDVGALDEWLKDAPAVRPGSIAPDQLRQVKNTLIVTATLASRAAVRGGMDVEDAFSLSDAYIRKCELLQTPDRIINLQYHMVLDFTSQVSNLKLHGNSSALAAAVAEYVRHHLSDPVSTEKIAEKLHFSRTWLSRKFHEETGIPLSDFIRIKKTEEAQRLLRYTDKSLREISVYLGYSSQSHFQTVFKKQLGVTPMQYRRNPPDRS